MRMVQPSKMSKIKNILRRWQSFARVGRSYSNLSSNRDAFRDHCNDWDEVIPPEFSEKRPSSLVHADNHKLDEAPEGCKTVYVGKCRRRYFISGEYLNHPLLRALIVERFRDGLTVACEVVLFEHLVWMLEDADPEVIRSDSSLEELAKFYTYD